LNRREKFELAFKAALSRPGDEALFKWVLSTRDDAVREWQEQLHVVPEGLAPDPEYQGYRLLGEVPSEEWIRGKLGRPEEPVEPVAPPKPKGGGAGKFESRPIERMKSLKAKLTVRKDAGKPDRGPLSLDQIKTEFGLAWGTVKDLEELHERGWDLEESAPGVETAPGFVRLPGLKLAGWLLDQRSG
jgi:hypothetical protein